MTKTLIFTPLAVRSNANGRQKAEHRNTWLSLWIVPRARSCIWGQHPSLNVFYKLVTLLEISVDQFFFPDELKGESNCRKQIDVMLNSMDEKELTVIKATAEGLKQARETEGA